VEFCWALPVDRPQEKCGVLGIYSPTDEVARLAFYGIYALQHRGQESAGIATAHGKKLHIKSGMGLVAQVFAEEDLSYLPGRLAIGHTRYSTTGSSSIENAQPLYVEGPNGPLALAHNGNLVNAEVLRLSLEDLGNEFSGSTDTEVVARMLASAPGADWRERITNVMRLITGAYCLVGLTPDTVFAMRDPYGIRPLCLGGLDGGFIIASETCALDHLGAEFIREVQPGEAIILDKNGFTSFQAAEPRRNALCVFEYIYFSRPDSKLRGRLLYPTRMAMGRELAREHPVEAGLVIGVPDSAIAAAIGYSHESGIPQSEGLVKNRYVGRTFIQPDQRMRDMGVYLKFNPMREVIEGQRLIVVDDSIVRGTTTPKVVEMLRRAGASEIHLRICSPPIHNPCHFGIDMATQWELIANDKSVEEVRQHVGADSLGYLSIDGLMRAIGQEESEFCTACFTGNYPMPVQLQMDKLVFERPARVGAGPEPVGAAWSWERDHR